MKKPCHCKHLKKDHGKGHPSLEILCCAQCNVCGCLCYEEEILTFEETIKNIRKKK
jgi:hypothetical protein